jgi:hypothetical protein
VVLVFIAVLYTTIGLKFSLAKKRRGVLTFSFLIGLVIGLIGGFVAIYNLKITKDVVIFNVELERWVAITLLAVVLGGLVSFFIHGRIRKK